MKRIISIAILLAAILTLVACGGKSGGSTGLPFVKGTVYTGELYDEEGAPIESAPHPFMKFFVRVPFAVREGDIMRSADR